MRRPLVVLLAIAALCSAAAPAAPAPPTPLSTLYTFYSGSDEALGLTWQGIASLNTATGAASKLCSLVFSSSGNPPNYGPAIIDPSSNSVLYSAYGNSSGSSSVSKITVAGALTKCASQQAFPLNGPLQAVEFFLVDAVTSAVYALTIEANSAVVIYQVNLASGATKEVASWGNYFFPYAIGVANGILVAWYANSKDGPYGSFSSSTVLVANLATNKTVTAKIQPLNGVSLMSSAFTYYQGSWLGLSTNPFPCPGHGNLSSYLLEFDPVHLTLTQVNNNPIVQLDATGQNLVNSGSPSVLQGANYLYFLQQYSGPLVIYDLANQVLVRQVAVTLDLPNSGETSLSGGLFL